MAKKRGLRLGKKAAFGVVAALVGAGSWVFVTFGSGARMQVPVHTVTEVIDGDSFFTKDRVLVRLASTDAPEMDKCGGPEAKEALQKLILGKQVYLHVLFVDHIRRVDSMVYTKDAWINKNMLAKGYSSYPRSHPDFNTMLQPEVQEAMSEKRGIYGVPCTQLTNLQHPSCTIKGNVRRNVKTYFLPNCRPYKATLVQLYLGDQWFCSEEEAKKAGFRKYDDGCP